MLCGYYRTLLALMLTLIGSRAYSKTLVKVLEPYAQAYKEMMWSEKVKKDASLKDKFRGGRKYRKKVEAKKTIKNMDILDLEYRKNELVAAGDKLTAIKYSQKLIVKMSNLTENDLVALGLPEDKRALTMLELADFEFDLGQLKRAEDHYKEFAALFPSHEKTEYACYKENLSSFLLILSADRDQTKTRDTIALCEAFLARATFKTYAGDVEKIKVQCCQRILESEKSIIEYYLHKGNMRSADIRFAKIDEKLLKMPECASLVSDMKLALETKKNELGIRPVLVANPLPTAEIPTVAARDIPALAGPGKAALNRADKAIAEAENTSS